MSSATPDTASTHRGEGLIAAIFRVRRDRRTPSPLKKTRPLLASAWIAAALALTFSPGPAFAGDEVAPVEPVNSIAAQIKASVGGKIKEFYRKRGYWPLWVRSGKLGPEAGRFIALVSSAELDGLDPDDYDPDELRKAVAAAQDGSVETLTRAELKLSKSFAEYVSDVRRAPVVEIRYLDQELSPKRLSEASVLRAAALAPSFADYMDNAGWMSPVYVRLRDALARQKVHWGKLPATIIPPGPLLRPGARGERVRLLRQRLGLPEGETFDKAVAAALREFQAEHGLPADALVGETTIAALNRPTAFYENLIRLNLERARILPGPWTRHILVDASSARLWLYDGGKQQDSMRVIVGKPTEQTPMLAGMMRYAIFNPYWNVPSDLVQQRIAAKMLDGGSLKKMRYEALSDWGATPQLLDPSSIDWAAVAQGKNIPRIRQLPGKDNAMGRMKFMFPNDLGIYLHDTPDKSLFKEKHRWFSSGCVRLEDAPRLAKWLFGKGQKTLSDVPEQHVALPEPVPVYLTYLTASPTDKGIAYHDDAYGRDSAPLARLANR